MIIDKNFLQMIMHSDTLNKTQFELLEYDADIDNWQDDILGKDISQETANLLILLKGKLALRGQETIVKNYNLMLEFNKTSQISEPPKTLQKTSKKVEIKNSDMLHIYCDGACLNNPGEAGSGLAVYDASDKPTLLFGRYEKLGTNNTAELNAFYKALSLASESNAKEIIIFSDSKYSIDCITKWAYGWKAKGWTKKGGEIKNLDIIKLSHALYEELKNKIQINHVKGHAGVEGNELADRMAGQAITAQNYEYEVFSYKNIDEVLDLKRG